MWGIGSGWGSVNTSWLVISSAESTHFTKAVVMTVRQLVSRENPHFVLIYFLLSVKV